MGDTVYYNKHKDVVIARVTKYKKENPDRRRYYDIKRRARLTGLDFTITYIFYKQLLDAVDICPILGTPLDIKSLDRIDNSKGYTPDNVQVISLRANSIKRDATFDELIKLGEWAKVQQGETPDDSITI